MMAKLMALVLIDVLLAVALLVEAFGSAACADIDSSSVLVMSTTLDLSKVFIFGLRRLAVRWWRDNNCDIAKSFLREWRE